MTLYGVEDWTQLADTPVLEIAPSPADARGSHPLGVEFPSVP